MIRTRQVLKDLSYRSLVRQGLIPDLVNLFSQTPQVLTVKRYPPWVYSSKDYSGFGVFIESIVQAGFRIYLEQPINPDIPFSKNMNEIAHLAYSEYPPTFEYSAVQKYIPSLVNMVKELSLSWKSYPQLNGTLQYHTEYTYHDLSAHPDLVTDQVVLDIKTTSSFSSMAEESALQILAYYAIIKLNNPNLMYTGLVLPMQRTVAIYDLSGWDSQPYIEFLSQEASKMLKNSQVDPLTSLVNEIARSFGFEDTNLGSLSQQEIYQKYHTDLNTIGSHHTKGPQLSISLLEFIESFPNRPVQMFISNPRTGKKNKITEKQIPEAAQIINSFNLLYFTHAPYAINLCANEYDEKKGDYWQQRYLNTELMQTVALGGRGVVVHTGAVKYGTIEDSLNTMELMVRDALPYATEECPLLLETSAGEGNDVCTQIEELGAFFYRFTEDERTKLGVCVDTCHVFSTGYNPLSYLQHWETYCKIRIGLIHFNDSKGNIGCCADRHAPIGEGKIGTEIMVEVARWANQRKIPMVRE